MLLRFTDNLIMQLTRDCNLHCKYCFQGEKTEWKDKYVSFEEFMDIVDTTIYERCLLGNLENNIKFHFHGGEVTLIPWEELKEMINYVLTRKVYFPGVSLCFQTNGTLLTEEMCKYFVENNVEVGVSIDSLSSEDRISVEATKKLVEHLTDLHNKTGITFGNLSVLSTHNMKTWFEDMRTLEKLGFMKSPGINLICTRPEDDFLIPSPEDQWAYWMKPVLESYLTDNPLRERDLQIVVSKVLQDIIFEIDKSSFSKTGCFDRICGHGANMIAVDPNLKVYNCDKYLEAGDFINYKEGSNLNQRDFLGFQQKNRVIQYYQKILALEKEVGCDRCKANWLCNGECQSYILSKYGEYRLNPEMCNVYKRVYDFISDHWIEIIQKSDFPIYGRALKVRSEALSVLEKNHMIVKLNFEENTFKGEMVK